MRPLRQNHLPPVLASAIKAELGEAGGLPDTPLTEHHPPMLIKILADELQVRGRRGNSVSGRNGGAWS
jgi:hypothetical protein